MDFATLLKRQHKTIAAVTLGFLAIALVITFVQPLKYGAEAKLLVVQDVAADADAYTVSRLNEYVSGVLTQIVTSETFYKQTLEAGFPIDESYFSGSLSKQISRWEDTINAQAHYDSGLMTLTVYHPDKEQALNIARAAIYTLKTSNSFYHSIPNVDIRVIDSATVSLLPVKPNIPLNIFLGVVIGVLTGMLYAYYREHRQVHAAVRNAAQAAPQLNNPAAMHGFQDAPHESFSKNGTAPENDAAPSRPLW